VAKETTQIESLCSPNFHNLSISEDVLDDESLCLLSPLRRAQCSGPGHTDASVSSEIPYTTPPRVKSSVTQASIEVEKPTEIPAQVIGDSNPVSCAHNSLSNFAVATHCGAETVSANVGQSFNSAGKACKVSLSFTCLPPSSTTCNVEVARTYNADVASAIAGQNSSYTSPPKLTSFWDELDILSDSLATKLDDLFPMNADDDPPFIGFGNDPRYQCLNHHPSPMLSDRDCSGMVNFDEDVSFPRRNHSISKTDGVSDRATMEREASPPKLRCTGRSQSRRKASSMGLSSNRTGKSCKVSVSSVCLPSLPSTRSVEDISSTVAGQNSNSASHCISSMWKADDDISFNHFSPQKQLGVVLSPDTGKCPGRRSPTIASRPIVDSRRRKRLFASKCSQVPPSCDQPIPQTSPSATGKQRCSNRKK